MLIQDAIAFINGLAKECKAESDKFWEQGCGEQASELMRRQRTFETVKEMLENYNALISGRETDCLSKAIDCLRNCSEQGEINPRVYVEAQAALNEYKRNHPSLVQIDKSNEYREQGYQDGYLDGVRDGKQIVLNKLQEFVEGSDED